MSYKINLYGVSGAFSAYALVPLERMEKAFGIEENVRSEEEKELAEEYEQQAIVAEKERIEAERIRAEQSRSEAMEKQQAILAELGRDLSAVSRSFVGIAVFKPGILQPKMPIFRPSLKIMGKKIKLVKSPVATNPLGTSKREVITYRSQGLVVVTDERIIDEKGVMIKRRIIVSIPARLYGFNNVGAMNGELRVKWPA